MINLIPSVKVLEEKSGFLNKNTIFCNTLLRDKRLAKALTNLPQSENGASINIFINGDIPEAYQPQATQTIYRRF